MVIEKHIYNRSNVMKILMFRAMFFRTGANHRAWDLMVSAHKIIEFMMSDSDPIYIAYRADGLDAGSREHVEDACKVLGEALTIYRLSHENPHVLSDITFERLDNLYE